MRTGRRVPPIYRKLHAASSEVTIRSKKQHFLPSKRKMPFLYWNQNEAGQTGLFRFVLLQVGSGKSQAKTERGEACSTDTLTTRRGSM